MAEYPKVENPIEGKEYVAINRLDNLPYQQGTYRKDPHCSANIILKSGDKSFYYSRNTYYLSLPIQHESPTPDKPIKGFSKALKEFRELKPIFSKAKEYFLQEKEKLWAEICKLSPKKTEGLYQKDIGHWYLKSWWDHNNKWSVDLHLGDRFVPNTPQEIIDRWRELCELEILLKEVG